VRVALGVLAAALAVAASACGGDEDGAGVTGAATTAATATIATTAAAATTQDDYERPEATDDQSRWARAVDAACAPWQDRIDAVSPPTDAADLDRWLTEALPLIRGQVAAVDGVASPPVRAEAFVQELRTVEQALTRYRQALRGGDAEAARRALAEAGTAGQEARDVAVSLGVTECGGYTQG
jgi:hypothetical protein